MPYERDVRAFDERAASYESGVLGQLHRDISSRVADLALSLGPAHRRVLDVGSGTGYLLGLLAGRLPETEELTGAARHGPGHAPPAWSWPPGCGHRGGTGCTR
jgi:hypothetical protein